MSKILSIAGVVICLAAAAGAGPLDPSPEELAKLDALGNRLPNAKILWVNRDQTIYYSPINNFNPVQVTTGAIPEKNPRWSPDGTKILFVRDPKGVWVMDADFSNPTLVIPDGDTASWTRDGRYITAVNASNRHQVIRYEISGGAETVIYDSQDGDYAGGYGAGDLLSQAAELRAGGRYLLTFTTDRSHHTYIVDLQDKQYMYNSTMDRGDCSPSWAPDGSYLLNTRRVYPRLVVKVDFNPGGNPEFDASDFVLLDQSVCDCSDYVIHGQRTSNDGQWVVVGGQPSNGSMDDNREIYIWKIGEGHDQAVRLTFESTEDHSPDLFAGQPADCQDSDGDGYGEGADCTGPDCDDSEREVHPGAAERCNDRDDDCDNQTDEDFSTLGENCQEGLGACQASGQIVCQTDGSGVECDAQPGQPGQEVCEGSIDEDCDGTVDNGCTCNDGDSRPCYGGPNGTEGVGECTGGTQDCAGGSWGSCDGQVLPQAENCTDSLDNDCDGLTDSADSEDCPSTEEDGAPGGDDAGTGEDGGEDAGSKEDAAGDSVVKGSCNCSKQSTHGPILLLAALAIICWRRKTRHVG